MNGTATTRPARSRALALGVFLVDLALVVGFVTVGRAAHAGDADAVTVVGGIPATGWPFVIGLLVAWVGGQAWRRPLAPWPTGVAVWVVTVGMAMALRHLTDDGLAPAFVVVASLVLLLALVGWRVLVVVVRREVAVSPSPAAPARPR